jgi:hypothetical protein
MTVDMWEAAARMFEPVKATWETPGQMARATNPKTIQTPALDLIDAALVEAFNTPDPRLSCAWHRRRTILSLIATPSDMALAQAL